MTDENIMTVNTIRASSVTGTSVFNREGEKLGSIDDLVIDKETGAARYAIMSFGGFLGLGEMFHPLPWETLQFDRKLEGYVVDLNKDALEAAPNFAPDNEPDWRDRRYGEDIRMYYGLPPVV